MNKTIKRLKAEIERRGGSIYINETLPDEIMELFLRQILDCPDCTHDNAQQKHSSGH
jgi:hypothetical protein